MDRHPVRQDHLPQPGRLGPAGELELTAATPFAPRGITFPLLLWLGIQFAIVALVSSRFPLWAKYPRTSETLTLPALLVTQVFSAAALFSILTRDWRSTAAVIVSAWPFTVVAAALSSIPNTSAALAGGYVSLWLLSLAAWRPLLRTERAVAVATAAAICITGSGPLTLYLLTDFATGSAVAGTLQRPTFSPIFGALAMLDAGARGLSGWLFPMLALSAAGLVAATRRRRTTQAG